MGFNSRQRCPIELVKNQKPKQTLIVKGWLQTVSNRNSKVNEARTISRWYSGTFVQTLSHFGWSAINYCYSGCRDIKINRLSISGRTSGQILLKLLTSPTHRASLTFRFWLQKESVFVKNRLDMANVSQTYYPEPLKFRPPLTGMGDSGHSAWENLPLH